jgi:imidazole glycerol phosphate synthase subunit HisF
LISKAASIYGEQSIVVCIDAKTFGGYNVYGRSGQDKYKISPDDFAKKVVNAGRRDYNPIN